MTEQITIPVSPTVTPETRTEIEAALVAHARSVVERLGAGVASYGTDSYGPLTHKMARDMFPELNITRDVWSALGNGGVYDGRTVPDRDRILAQWRGEVMAEQPPLPDMPPVPEGKPAALEAVERTCGCEGCTDPECQGDCDQCDDRDCEQCHGDDCEHETVRCRDCESDPRCEHDHECTECGSNDYRNCTHCGGQTDGLMWTPPLRLSGVRRGVTRP